MYIKLYKGTRKHVIFYKRHQEKDEITTYIGLNKYDIHEISLYLQC